MHIHIDQRLYTLINPFSLSVSLSIDVSSTTSIVCPSPSCSCLLYLGPQRCSRLPVSLAEIFYEGDAQLFADSGVLGHLPQRVSVCSLSELDDDMPCFVFLTSAPSVHRGHNVVGDFHQQVSNHFARVFFLYFFYSPDPEIPPALVTFQV